ncbi:flagellar operon protein [Amphibacillus marinus]|uniref:Flagellar operon protein n=1 Tax=Amphibacillus marinus TaxID=872970 RepID=A0A1H8HRZ5_9BACI|nr:TIGR02530 family flagellar biosynthesis protein [Amphibacillus marinus]SEN58755.1 flagellar operon protein [Amphibacillus marinus]
MGQHIPHIDQRSLIPAAHSSRSKRMDLETSRFSEVLRNSEQQLKITKHAQQRLNQRNIKINEETWQEIASHMQLAKQKGITDSLVVTSEATLVVNAKNNTIITAMNREEASSRLFTNINGTIILD